MAGPAKKEKEPTGPRPEWKARQARKRFWGIIKLFLGVMFLGVLVGLGIVFKEQLLALFEKKETAKVATTVKPPPPTPAPATKVVEAPPPAVTPPPPVDNPKTVTAPQEIVPSGEEEAARKLIKDGQDALEQFKFDDAAQLFNQAVVKKCGAQLRSEAKVWASKAANFKLATKHIPVTAYATAETSYLFVMKDGTEFNGLKVEENDETITFQRVPPENPAVLGTMKFPLPRLQIGEQIPISRQKRSQQFLQLLGQLESNITIQASTDYYDLVYLSRRLNLGKECIQYLNRAFDGGPGHKPDYDVGGSFRKEVVRRAIERASLMVAGGRTDIVVSAVLNDLKKTLPDFQYASEEIDAFKMMVKTTVKKGFQSTIKVTETKRPEATVAVAQAKNEPPKPTQSAKQLAAAAEGDQIDFVVENEGVTGHGAAASVVDRANQKYEEGMATYRKFRQGTNGNNNQVLRAAMKLLVEAVDLYDEALQKEPGNNAVLSRQTEANMIVYACKKYQTL